MFYVLSDLFSWIISGISTPTAPSDCSGRKQDRPSKECAFSMSSSCRSNSRISQRSLPQPGEYQGIPTGHAGVRERRRKGGMDIQGEGPEKYDDSFVISLSSSNLPKAFVPVLLNPCELNMQRGSRQVTRTMAAEVCLLESKQCSVVCANNAPSRKGRLNVIFKMGVTQSTASPGD